MEKFNYNYYSDLIGKLKKKYGENLSIDELLSKDDFPLQIEIQMGLSCGGYQCKFCYGKHTQKEDIKNPVDIETYFKFISEIKDRAKFIQFAGINTDPLGSRNFVKLVERIKDTTDIKIGVHTKGLLLTNKIIKELNRKTSYGDFITFSVDTVDKNEYNSLHGLPENSKFMERVITNIKNLYNHKLYTNSELNVNVSALLMEENSSYQRLRQFVEVFKNHSDRIRFSFPQIPNLTSKIPEYYIKDKSLVHKNLEILKAEYPEVDISYLKFDSDDHNTTFKKCQAQQYLFAINPSGFVFPCPQVTSSEFYDISYGNIKENTFDEIWNSNKRKQILNMKVSDMECRICDRKDENINCEVDKRWKNI